MSDFLLSLQIALIGVLVVFIVLLILMVILTLPQMLKKKEKEAVNEPVETKEKEGIPAHHLVAIAAAIAMLDQPHRIKNIKLTTNSNWERCRYTDVTTS